ncbi:MAG: hypothetical protein P8I56_01445 [Paracoccaceae bacterium]|jgi:prophage endopeptidase|nr:hypothetical protein [Paracoccaceae bacterium]
MTEQDLALLIAAALFAAFTLGWVAHWLWSVTTRKRSPEALRVEAIAADLLQAEAERDAVREAKAETETSLSTEFTAREQELEVKLRETEAELAATMDGLRAARQELIDKR